MPPAALQWRTETRVERLNTQVYGVAWAWLPLPVWLALVDPYSDGAELARLTRLWSTRGAATHIRLSGNAAYHTQFHERRRNLPVLR